MASTIDHSLSFFCSESEHFRANKSTAPNHRSSVWSLCHTCWVKFCSSTQTTVFDSSNVRIIRFGARGARLFPTIWSNGTALSASHTSQQKWFLEISREISRVLRQDLRLSLEPPPPPAADPQFFVARWRERRASSTAGPEDPPCGAPTCSSGTSSTSRGPHRARSTTETQADLMDLSIRERTESSSPVWRNRTS